MTIRLIAIKKKSFGPRAPISEETGLEHEVLSYHRQRWQIVKEGGKKRAVSRIGGKEGVLASSSVSLCRFTGKGKGEKGLLLSRGVRRRHAFSA